MTHPLDGIRAKLQRADENIVNLNREIGLFLTTEPKPYRVAGEHQDGGRKYAFIAYGEPVAPLRLAVLAGEIIHHLRSTLDHLVHALVIQSGETPTATNQFPLARTAAEYEQLCTSGLIKGVARTAKKRIRAEQPYHNGEPQNTTLRVLHECRIVEKHRSLLVLNTAAVMGESVVLVPGPSPIDPGKKELPIIGFGDPAPRRITKDGVEIFYIRFAEPEPNTTADIDHTAHVVFDKLGSIELVSVIPVLTTMFRKVSSVVPGFKTEFGG